MQVNVSPVNLAALKADGTIRCLADVKYQPVPASQHSSTVFALAMNLADEFTTALVGQLGHVTATHSNSSSPTDTCKAASAQAQLYAAQLRRNRMVVCFDLFLDSCTPEFRREIDETAARPIHAVAKLGDDNRYQVDRKLPLDARVPREIAWIQEIDKGPRPYFAEDMNPPCYDDGIRVEYNLEERFLGFPHSKRTGHQK